VQALNRQGWKAVAVHGDASQAQRTAAVDSFKVMAKMLCLLSQPA
jgi:superfamily II DNA/RNA helicase